MIRRILWTTVFLVPVFGGGCGSKGEAETKTPEPEKPRPPRAVVKRVPCKLKFGPLAAALEVDLSEIRQLGLDAKQLYGEVVRGEPTSSPPPSDSPVVMVVNKKGNKVTYLPLTPNVREIRVRTQDSKDVELIVQNKNPLRIELWVNTDSPVDLDVEFTDDPGVQS